MSKIDGISSMPYASSVDYGKMELSRRQRPSTTPAIDRIFDPFSGALMTHQLDFCKLLVMHPRAAIDEAGIRGLGLLEPAIAAAVATSANRILIIERKSLIAYTEQVIRRFKPEDQVQTLTGAGSSIDRAPRWTLATPETAALIATLVHESGFDAIIIKYLSPRSATDALANAIKSSPRLWLFTSQIYHIPLGIPLVSLAGARQNAAHEPSGNLDVFERAPDVDDSPAPQT